MAKNTQILGFFLFALFSISLGHPPLQNDFDQRSRSRNHPVRGKERFTIPTPKYRLNDTFIPSNYQVELVVILDNDPDIGAQFTAPGKVTILAKPATNTNEITLHSNLLQINYESIKVSNPSQPDLAIGVTGHSNVTDSEQHFLTLTVNTTLEATQEYQIYIEFVAPISADRPNGLYLSTYIDPTTGEERRHAATQMEAVHARQLFPCFDEPHLKATFDVTIIHKNNYTSLANSALDTSKLDPSRPGWVIDKFLTTAKMSTYIFAIVVSDFTSVEAAEHDFKGKPVKVHAPPYMIERGGGDYSAETAAQLLIFFDNFFETDYPFTKMDSVAVPVFDAGAMENYGLNLYRITALIYYPGESLETERNSITNVLAHELAHQNFGNLVTCEWWSQIWLNEGYATYVSYLGQAEVTPEFQSKEAFLNEAFQYSMTVDLSPTSHPLQNSALTPESIDLYWSGITYEKGASINRMMSKFLTEETFHKGLRNYLEEMKFQGAHSDDLFRILQEAAIEDNRLPAGVDMKSIMDTWTKQIGYPVVSVAAFNDEIIGISQQSYSSSNANGLWYVPYKIITEDNPTMEDTLPSGWLEPRPANFYIAHDSSKWILVNPDAIGYYRVLYDDVLLSNIQRQLETDHSVITQLSRSQLLDDYFTFSSKETASIDSALNLTRYLKAEDHFTVWDVVFIQMRYIYNMLDSSVPSYTLFKNYMLPRIESALLKVGIPQDPVQHIGAAAIHRMKLLDWACSMEHPECIKYAQELYATWQADLDTNPIAPDIQASILCTIVAAGDKPVYNFTLQQYKAQAAGSGIKTRLRNALACTKNSTTIQELLDLTLSDSSISLADKTGIWQRLATSTSGRGLVINFLISKTTDIISTIGLDNLTPIGSVVNTLSGFLNTQQDHDTILQFVVTNAEIFTSIQTSLSASLDKIKQNIEWRGTTGVSIVNWLSKNQ